MLNYLEDTQLDSAVREIADPGELDELRMLATKLSSLDQPELSQVASEATLRQLLSRQSAGRRAPFWRSWRFIGGPLIASLRLSVVVLAQGVAPRTPLYGVKRVSESARLALDFTTAAKAHLCAVFKPRRASELASAPPRHSPVWGHSLPGKTTR